MSNLVQDLRKAGGKEVYLTMDQINELHNNAKSIIDLTTTDVTTLANGEFGKVKSIPVFLKN